MVRKVRLKKDNKTVFVKLLKNYEFGIPSITWIDTESNYVYHSDDLVFIDTIKKLNI